MSDVRDPERDQPLPISNDGPSMHDLVLADLQERKEHGLSKHGSLLQGGNGRIAMKDLYEELLDAVVYARQELYERQNGLHFDWDLLDRYPGLAAQSIITSAPLTTQFIQVAVLRSISAKVRLEGEGDDKVKLLLDAGFDDWLENLADQIDTNLLEQMGYIDANPDVSDESS